MDDPTLRPDLDAATRFLHVLGMQTKEDVRDVATRLFALIEELVARGQLDLRSFDARRERVAAREVERERERAHVQVADVPDKYAVTDVPPIPCAELIPLCKGRCCRLSFPLSFQDLEERVLKWDYARPYQIRHAASGYCVHSDEETRGCTVYAQRPTICRTYDCRADKRIWIDYEKRIPAPEDAIGAPLVQLGKRT